MKEKIIEFLDQFFKAEVNLLNTYKKPNLENYNNSVNEIDKFAIEKLSGGFGAKLSKLRNSDFYENVKNFPEADKRFLFRIDEFETSSKQVLYKCFVSEPNPDGWKEFSNILIVGIIDEELKIVAKSFFTNTGMGNGYWWNFGGGDEKFMQHVDERYILNEEAFGTKNSELRLIEPENDEDEMLMYN